MSQQQTVLRVKFNNNNTTTGITEYRVLDLYQSVPIAINKSFAELGDIGKRNSDYSIGLLLPGSKTNNAFFESYFNVDAVTLYFNPTLRVGCDVLINDEVYFTGYLKLNKISVQNSKVEYDVNLFSTVADLYGTIGNNLLKDLNYADPDFTFNHEFNLNNVTEGFNYTNFARDEEQPFMYFYPVVHNGYNYTGSTVNFTGGTILERSRLFTSTNPIGSYASLNSFTGSPNNGQLYRINTPTQGPYNNQLKPGLSIWGILQLMFKTYGYTIQSDFFNTPWMKSLYLYGYFSSDDTKFSWNIYTIDTLPIEGIRIAFIQINNETLAIVTRADSGIPCYCEQDVEITLNFDSFYDTYSFTTNIPYGTSGLTFEVGLPFLNGSSSNAAYINLDTAQPSGYLKYLPKEVGDTVNFVDGDYVDFSLVIDQNIKQIDILSSLAKKFDLVIVPDLSTNNPFNLIIEPYDFYIGSGQIHNWSNLISFDKGFTVEPALNYLESNLQLTDSEDNDEGNKQFKSNKNRIYGWQNFLGPTSFKSQEKKIDTIFGPELIRKWDRDDINNISIPLGINYVGSSQESISGTTSKVDWIYKGVKTKPKLFWWLGSQNPFLDIVGENYDATYYFKSYMIYISNSSGSTYIQSDRLPVISHTMPMGLSDKYKINNDSQCLLFNSELPEDTDINVTPYNAYTENDAFNTFYLNRVSNIYNPNTRVLTGNFNLSYSDLKNLKPQDLIKINEQYFVVSKIDGFNLTNRELTKVELVQFNTEVKQYPKRYFMYNYCDGLNTCTFKFETDFTNSNLLDTNFGWSVYYDNQVGFLGSPFSSFTSTFKYVQGASTEVYCPYTMYEVDIETYNSTGVDWIYDTLHQEIYNNVQFGPFQYSMPTFWLNSGSTRQGTNLFTNCTEFYNTASNFGILTGSSIYFGQCTYNPTPTPTPTSTITPTPTPTITPTSATPTPTPTITTTPTVTPTMETPTPTPTPTSTPYVPACLCYLFQNEDSQSSTVYYTPCGGSSTSEVIGGGQAIRRCIDDVAETPSYTGGVTTIVPCTSVTSCTTNDNCTGCS